MRASEIKEGESYAVVGKGISRARVRVLSKERIDRRSVGPVHFRCMIEEGLVYTGWAKTPGGNLDTEYVGLGNVVLLVARDFVRPWETELERRAARDSQREHIGSVLSEMDEVLNALGLSAAFMQMVQTPAGPIAVTVLGIEELKAIYDRIKEDSDD